MKSKSEILLYQTEDGQTKIEVRLDNETVWLTLNQLSELFGKAKSTISEHIRNVFEEGELHQDKATVRNFRTVQTEGSREVSRDLEYYNLDVIISVGYRVKSHRGTQFRIWATQRLREYIIKGFTLNDERLKETGHTNQYFNELLERIRDIRSSEKIFYAKIKDIYTTSIDYDTQSEQAKRFFAAVQNKMHWAIHGHTAAEIIYKRTNAKKPSMGLTSWKNSPEGKIRKTDVAVAKNYLSQDELTELNLIVEQYLAFGELQARNRKSMYMNDWEKKLNAFLTLNEREILLDAGRISHKMAKELAENEYKTFRKQQIEALDAEEMKRLEQEVKKLKGKK
ncbi:MAG: hypothetical protein FVQ77_04400 [Cytophagales bacterium]|nr:hypothetical protein [Cytophagales bacterium]